MFAAEYLDVERGKDLVPWAIPGYLVLTGIIRFYGSTGDTGDKVLHEIVGSD